MKKRMIPIAVLFVLMLSISAHAVELQAIRCTPSLSFDGTAAICSVDCKSGNSTDRLSVTLTLWQESTWVDSWTSSGTGRVLISEQCIAKSGKDYKLVLSYTVNGQAQSSVSVTGTCP